jgi:glutamyl-tRNA synthetase
MILRIEDLDHTRTRPWADAALYPDLEWLGLDWDQEYTQSQRLEIYAAYLPRLDTYLCSCSRKDIAEAASAPHGAEAVYPGTCRFGPIDPDRPLAVRWRVPDQILTVHDQCLGSVQQGLIRDVGDWVLRRNDGVFAYHLAVVIDDALMGVTHILRGADLWPSTPRQVALQQALGFVTPVYTHVPLMRDFRGERLAKRNGAPSVAALRERGENPQRVVADLARSLGLDVPECVSASELLQAFDWRNLPSLLNRVQ